MTTEPPTISVIIPVRDGSAWISRCLEGLLSQQFDSEAFEVIVVDNGSIDRSVGLVRQFASVRLLKEEKSGPYAARNRGVAASRGTILAFTDADCVPQADWLRRIDAAMKVEPAVVLLGQRLPASGSRLLALWNDYEAAKEEFVFWGEIPELFYGHTNNMAMSREVFERLGPFQERPRGSDTIFVRQVVDALGCGAVTFVPDMKVRHLELTGGPALLKKLFIYGRSSSSYERVIPVSPISNQQRWKIFRDVIETHRYPIASRLGLFGLLAAGLSFWTLGRWAGWLRAAPPASGQDSRQGIVPESNQASD